MIDQDLFEKLKSETSPEGMTACLEAAGIKVPGGGDEKAGPDPKPASGGDPKPASGPDPKPPFGKDASKASSPDPVPFSSPPDEPYEKARSRALKKSAKDEGMDFGKDY